MDEYYSYYDAIEETGEVIYCGKGNNDRIQSMKRNRYYNNIVRKHKLVRTIIPMLDEDLALKYENWLMEYYHTWVDDPNRTEHACNIDGPGTNGGSKTPSKETIEKNRQTNKIKQAGENNGFFNKKHTQETKDKIKAKRALQVFTDEHRQNMSKAHKGKKFSAEARHNMKLAKTTEVIEKTASKLRGRKRKPFSEETCDKIRKAKSKSVYQIDLITKEIIKLWSSATEAARILDFNQSNICQCCLGRSKQYHGFIWKYVGEA